jgi:hypothetical protein
MINPTIDAQSYLTTDDASAPAKNGTTVQAGWGAADKILKPKKSGDYPTDFRFSEQTQLVRFLDDEPFAIYEQHWIDRTEGKRSFVCLGDECPLCTMLGDNPRPKFAFNILNLSEENPSVQILTATPTLARQLQSANQDPRLGPLSKYYWSIARQGTGPQTQYMLNRVKATDLAEDWELDSTKIDAIATSAIKHDSSAVYVSPREELLTLARQLLS